MIIPMAAEASCGFDTSEALADYLASTPLLADSWRLCRSTTVDSPGGFQVKLIGDVGYFCFSGLQSVLGSDQVCGTGSLVLSENVAGGVFGPLCRCSDGEEPVKVHSGLLPLFWSFYNDQNFQTQIWEIMKKCKSVVVTGHSIGGALASLSTLWLLSCLKSISSNHALLCITFGSPLLGNESLHRAILRERWGGNFCHIVTRHDIMPRLLFAPPDPLVNHIKILVQFLQFYMAAPDVAGFASQLNNELKAKVFDFVMAHLKALAEGTMKGEFWPFGTFFFCSQQGAICLDNAASVVKIMHLLLATGSPNSCVEDHLKYGDYVGKVSLQFLKARDFLDDQVSTSSYDASLALALQSSELATEERVAVKAIECLKMAKQIGGAPNLNAANLAIKLSKITPYRAQIEWYKACCDEADDQMGYYDSFKLRGASRRDSRVNMNRLKLAAFWNNLIHMLETNQLPHDFHKRAKWVNASQFYMLLVEPLDIADYYRTEKHRKKGHYIQYGRERRYEIFDKWWKDRRSVMEQENCARSKLASLTQDSCFWAKVEEARECLNKVRSEIDLMKKGQLWDKLQSFACDSRKLVYNKCVSKDVLAKNSSYSRLMEEYTELKSQLQQIHFPRQFPILDGHLVP